MFLQLRHVSFGTSHQRLEERLNTAATVQCSLLMFKWHGPVVCNTIRSTSKSGIYTWTSTQSEENQHTAMANSLSLLRSISQSKSLGRGEKLKGFMIKQLVFDFCYEILDLSLFG